MTHPGDDPVIDVAAMRALAHPLRVRLYDLVSGHGPLTASMLARQLGESSGSTSYHLRTLARHGLIEDDPDRTGGRERWWRRTPGGLTLLTPDSLTRPGERASAQALMREFDRGRTERRRQFLDDLGSWSDDWHHATVDLISNLRLDAAETRNLVSELATVIDRYRDRLPDRSGVDVSDVEPVEVQLSVFPKRLPQVDR